jgi:hypothetical protein
MYKLRNGKKKRGVDGNVSTVFGLKSQRPHHDNQARRDAATGISLSILHGS